MPLRRQIPAPRLHVRQFLSGGREDGEDEEDGEEEEEEEEEEDDGTRWGWLPHAGSAESGWMDENAFRKHFGKTWKAQWEKAECSKMPQKAQFREFYGSRVYLQHWQWHNEDDDATLLSTREARDRNVVDYEVLLSALRSEGMDYGESVDEQTWNENMKTEESPEEDEDDEDWKG